LSCGTFQLEMLVGDLTKRNKILKLELSGETFTKLQNVAETLYNYKIDNADISEAEDSTQWPVIDKKLYFAAKESYDQIIKAFDENPKVYKFASCKEKIWETNAIEYDLNADEDNNIKSLYSERKVQEVDTSVENFDKNSNDVDPEQATYINPFTLIEDHRPNTTGSSSEINSSIEVWVEKLHILQKLTPREDLAGYEYRESVAERRQRIKKQRRYEALLQQEIERRENDPTPIEQVEDALFFIVETVANQEERMQKVLRHKERRQIQKVGHPATNYSRLRPMLSLTKDNGITKPIMSDMDIYTDLITVGGFTFPQKRPWDLLVQHELERDMERLIQRRRDEIEAIAYENMPITLKVANALKLLKEDPKKAVREIISKFRDHTNKLKQTVQESIGLELSTEQLNNSTTNDTDFDFLKSLRSQSLTNKEDGTTELDVSNLPLDEYVERVFDKYKRIDRKTTLPDTIRIKLLFVGNLPPPYIIRPRRTWKDEWDDTKKKTKILADSMRSELLSKIQSVRAYSTATQGGEKSESEELQEREAVETQSELKTEAKVDEKGDEPLIDIRKILVKKNFGGWIKPTELVYVPPTVEGEVQKLHQSKMDIVFDNSERKLFEETMLRELATAACLPVNHLQFEEIKRLPVDSSNLIALKNVRDSLLAKHLEMEALEKEKEAQSWNDFYFESNKVNLDDKKDANSPSKVPLNEEEKWTQFIREKLEKQRRSLLPPNFAVSDGIRNPSDLLRNPKYWFKNGLKKYTDEKKRQHRLFQLEQAIQTYKYSEREKELRQALQRLRDMKDETIENVVEKVMKPLFRKVLNPTYRTLKPYAVIAAEAVMEATAVSVAELNQLYQRIATDPRVIEAIALLKIYLAQAKVTIESTAKDLLITTKKQVSVLIAKHLRTTTGTIFVVLNSNETSDSNKAVLDSMIEVKKAVDFMCDVVEQRNLSGDEVSGQVMNALKHLCEAVIARFDDNNSLVDGSSSSRSSSDKGSQLSSSSQHNEDDFERAIELLKNDRDDVNDTKIIDKSSKSNEELVSIRNSNSDSVSQSESQSDTDLKGDVNFNLEEVAELDLASAQLAKMDEEIIEMKKELITIQNLNLNNQAEFDDRESEDLSHRNRGIDIEIIDLMDQIILSIEFAQHDIHNLIDNSIQYNKEVNPRDPEDISDESNQTVITDEGPDSSFLNSRVYGYEITLMVLVNDTLRKSLHLEKLFAEDVAVLLEHQLFDFRSPLHLGKYSKDCVQISHSMPFKRRVFAEWEEYWVNVLHPTFFGYSALDRKPRKRNTDKAKNENAMIQSAIESGIRYNNPLENFTKRNKETFESLKQDLPEDVEESNSKSAMRRKNRQSKLNATRKSAYSIGVDDEEEGQTSHKVLKIFRPNMSNVSIDDIDRLSRLYRAFKAHYEEEMQTGLIDGMGLKPEQYQALKNRDTAFRLMRAAKSRYNHMHRHETDPHRVPDFHPTPIDLETFNGWVEEVRKEDRERLWELRKEKERMQIIMQQEAELRKKYAQQRQWVIHRFIECCGEDAVIIGKAIYDKLTLLENAKNNPSSATGPTVSSLDVEDQQYVAEVKKSMIAEAKKTRKMFDRAGRWVKESIKKATNLQLKIQRSHSKLSRSSSKHKINSYGFKVRGISVSKMSTHSKSSGRLSGRSEINTARSVLREILHEDSTTTDALSVDAEVTAVVDKKETEMESPQKDQVIPPAVNIILSDSNRDKSSEHSGVVSVNKRKSRVSFSILLNENSSLNMLNTEENMIASSCDADDRNIKTKSRSDSDNNRSFHSPSRKLSQNSPKVSNHNASNHELIVSEEEKQEVVGTADTEIVESVPLPVENQEGNSDLLVDDDKLKLNLDNLDTFIDDERDSDDDEDDEEEAIPTVIKNDLFAFLDKSLATIRQTEKQQRHDKKMIEKSAKAVIQERRLLSIQKHQPNSPHVNLPASNVSSSGSESETDEEEYRDVMTLLNPHADVASLAHSPDRPGKFMKVPSDHPMSSRSELTAHESEKSSNSRSQVLSTAMHQQQAFLPIGPEDIQIVKSLKWVEYMLKHKQFFTCLRELPTIDSSTFSKDELSQFASILAEVGPVVSKIILSLKHKREQEELQLLNRGKKVPLNKQQMSKRKRKLLLRQERILKEAAKEQNDAVEKLQLEANRLVEIRKQAEKDRAIAMAHTHRYIKFTKSSKMHDLLTRLNKTTVNKGDEDEEDSEPFCMLCRENVHNSWLQRNDSDETERMKNFEEHVSTIIENIADDTRREAEVQMKEVFAAEAKKILQLEDDAAASVNSSSASQASHSSLGSNAHDRAWRKELAAAKDLLTRAELPQVDPRGVSTLPREPPRVDEVRPNKPVLTKDESAFNESCGMKIRIWNRDAEGLRSNFLGVVSFSEKDVLNPPKGIRTYKLQSDPYIIETSPLEITGTISVKYSMIKGQRKKGVQATWYLQILRFNQLPAVHPKLLSNPYCEVYWRGSAQKFGTVVHTLNWVSVGTTKVKPNTQNCTLSKDDDMCWFELPPEWTDLTIPAGREFNLKDKTPGGGWVPRNSPLVVKLLDNAIEEENNSEVGSQSNEKPNTFFASIQKQLQQQMQPKTQSPEDILNFRVTVKVSEMMVKEVQKRLDVVRLRLNAEERDRQCMNSEELQQRNVYMKQQLHKYKHLIEAQNHFSRVFMRLQLCMQSPPPFLTRVRYMMGEELQGGGLKVFCQDPVDNSLLNVVTVPLLHKQDEDTFVEQTTRLIGKPSQNLVKVLGYYLFQAKEFNSVGFTSVEERTAVVAMEYYPGPTFMTYIRERFDTITNDEFRDLLNQVAMALMQLHEIGIVHRNISPDCIIVHTPNVVLKPSIHNASIKATPKKLLTVKPTCRLGDYLLVHNPRAPGCGMSYGRADWGQNRHTAPPEALLADDTNHKALGMKSSSIVSFHSDIYAFGVCVFHWATNGLPLPERHQSGWSEEYLDRLRRLLPLKWEKWLHALLAMCLQPKPEARSTAKDIHQYLTSRFGKK